MKRTAIAAVLVAGLAAQPLLSIAQTKSDSSGTAQGAAAESDSKLREQMTEHMRSMQEQMDKIRQTTDASERQKLLAEHMAAMQEGMKTMQGTGGGMMMGMMGGGAMAGGGQPGGAQSLQMMENRLDMMQVMMAQMMEHMQMMQPAPGK
jgi:hypothetical protein